MRPSSLVLAVLPCLLAGCQSSTTTPDPSASARRVQPAVAPKAAPPNATFYEIRYHKGPIMTGPVNVYFIWYGNWAGNTAPTILSDFMADLGGEPYNNMNTSFYDSHNNHIANSVTFWGGIDDHYSRGNNLGDLDVPFIVDTAISNGRLPADANGVYFVLASADVHQFGKQSFCTKTECGWHDHTQSGGRDIKYAFVGNPDQCPSQCNMVDNRGNPTNVTNSPNGNPGADSVARAISHELVEAENDPDGNAWYADGTQGFESADHCQGKWGTTTTLPNGALANVVIGDRNFLLQQQMVVVNTNQFACTAPCGYCDLSL